MKRLLPKSEFGRNVLTLATGTTIAQFIPIAISPILTRIYTPDDFGLLGIYISMITFISSFACGKYELAIMLPKKEREGFNLAILSMSICLIVSLLSALILWLFNSEIAMTLKISSTDNLLYLIPASILLSCGCRTLFYYNSRKKNYKLITNSRLLKSITTAIGNLTVGFIIGGTSGLLFSFIFGQIAETLTLIRKKITALQLTQIKSSINPKEIAKIGIKYRKFPLFFSLSYGLNSLSNNIIPLLLGMYFDMLYAGYYFLLARVIKIPTNIISGAVHDVFYQKAAHQKDCRMSYLATSGFLFLIGLIPTLIIFLYGEDLFAFAFNEEWREAGKIASILIFMYFLEFVTIPVSQFTTIHQKAAYNILWQVSLVFIMLFGCHIGSNNEDVYIFFTIYSIGQSLLYIIGYFYEYRLCTWQALKN